METLNLASGYDRAKKPQKHPYRYMAIAEAQNLQAGQRVHFIGTGGKARLATVNGAPRTWKRDPLRVEVPVKYGMYEYATMANDAQDRVGNHTSFLIVPLTPRRDQ